MNKEKKFIELLAERENIAVSKIEDILKIDRKGLDEILKYFQDLGYSISYLPNGYLRLEEFTSKLDSLLMKVKLNTKFIAKEIEVYDLVDSTNLIALREKGDLSKGKLIIAEGQLKGRGRLGRSWQSAYGKGIYLSLVLKPSNFLSLSQITLLGAISVAITLEKLFGFEIYIHWPNDVIVKNKKIAGILAEANDRYRVVLGIGINVNQGETEIPSDATSIYFETNRKENRNIIVSELLNIFEELYLNWEKKGIKFLKKYWKKYTNSNSKLMKIKTNSKEIYGSILDIDENGAILRLESGNYMKIHFNEVLEVR
jgi:BirA family biotin operon repressor/biotin-[acetyl-CoA-carboxylase] ligase